jgi:predicted phosphodiesterase
MSRLNDAQIKTITDSLQAGISQRKLAKILDLPRTTIQYYAQKLVKNDPDRPTKGLVLSDLQVPYHDPDALDAVLEYAADEGGWDWWIQIGDFMDFKYLHKLSAQNLRILNEGCFEEDYRVGRRVLRDIKSSMPGARGTILEGNHDYRVASYLDLHPQLRGVLEVPVGLDLQRARVQWVENWSKGELVREGKATFTHGRYVNQYHAAKHARQYGCNIFYGHVHDVQSHSLEKLGDNDTIVAQSIGCLCQYDQEYMRGAPSKWQQAFAVFYIEPNGHFTYYVPRIIDGSFVAPNGKRYSG